jgi:chorismate dehydratase
MTEAVLRISDSASLAMLPFYSSLKKNYAQPFYSFIRGNFLRQEEAMKKGYLDLGLVSSFAFASDPGMYLILPGLGLASQGPVGFALLFSDILLEDLDEMTVSVSPVSSDTSTALLKIILGRYLQYANEFETSWAKADAHILVGDSALRERMLARYLYIYDLGELWHHYTGQPLIFSLWMVRADAAQEKQEMIRLFCRSLKYAVEEAEQDWENLAKKLVGYDWIKTQDVIKFWKNIDYQLGPEHYQGLTQFYEDANELGLIEGVPELQFLEIE